MNFRPSHRLLLILAFASVYLVWGSTYLAIRYAIQTLPTWGLAATRFLVAGAVMLWIARISKEAKLSVEENKNARLTGMLFMTANAVVCLVERWIPSGIVAVAIGAMPIWVMLVGRISFGQATPSAQKWIGALVGLSGVSIIALSETSHSEITGLGKYAIFILFLSSITWAVGTHLQRKIKKIESPFRYAAWQMLYGAASVSVFSLVSGEWSTFEWTQVSTISLTAWAYLVVFGSIVAFTAYSWLGRNVDPHVLSSYALVNPVIAVFLGWVLANEPITPQFLVATALVCAGLGLLLINRRQKTVATLEESKLPQAPTTQEVFACLNTEKAATAPQNAS